MRRFLALLLLAAFGLPTAAPLLAQIQDADAKLPACCRRAGAHHCTMSAAVGTHTPMIGARCPRFPQPSASSPHLQLSGLSGASLSLIAPDATQASCARAEVQRRVSRERSRHKRGPPAVTLAA